MRVTWIQPEDLVGHELRQAREEKKDVDEIEERWLAGGGSSCDAPRAGAGLPPPATQRSSIASTSFPSSRACRSS